MRRLFVGLAIAGIALLAPCWALAGDTELAQQIAASLKSSGKMHGYSIGVKAQEGTVWLNGTVRSQQQLRAALEVVGDIPGVEKIVNGLTVIGADASVRPANAQASDARMAIGSRADYEAPVASAMPYGGSGTGSGVPLPLGGGVRMAMMQQQQGMPMQSSAMQGEGNGGTPIPTYAANNGGGIAPAHFDRPQMPGYAWPSYASAPNYAGITYPRQYSATAWPFIGPFYPYPQVPLGWRKVSLEWHNGWWMLDFRDHD